LQVLALASLALALPVASQAAAKAPPPAVSTGGVSHVRGSSAVLNGAVNPRGAPTTYYFQYGPTVAYGSQTTAANLPAGEASIDVGQTATGFLSGYHYRLVASNEHGQAFGKDRTFAASTIQDTLALLKPSASTVFGSTLTLSGSLSGTVRADQQIVLQASPYPYLEAFSNVGLPVVTNAAGGFSFHVPSLSTSTQFRANTVTPRPIYSPVVTARVAVRVTLSVRSAGHKGLVRLYGTVTPAEVGARVDFQLNKPARPGNTEATSEVTTKFSTQFSSLVKRGTKATSRFSTVVKILHGGEYRAYVQVPKGALLAGSSQTVVLGAAPKPKGKAKKH